MPQIILFLSILNFLLIESFNKVESPSGYKCDCSSVFFAEEKIFFGITNGDSFDESFITFFSPFILDSPGTYLAMSLIVGLISFKIVFIHI